MFSHLWLLKAFRSNHQNPRKNLGFYRFHPFDAMLQINKNFVFASSKMYALWDSTDAMIWNGILVNLGLLREPLGAPLGPLGEVFWRLLDLL